MNIERMAMSLQNPLIIPALVLAAGASTSSGQTLRGRVVDAESSQGLAAAVVTVEQLERGRPRVATTDSAGAFEIILPQSGGYRIGASLPGYLPLEPGTITIGREQVHVTLRLSRQAIPLESIIVTARRGTSAHLAEFERRRASSGAGYFITRNQIERRSAATAATLVLGVPGVNVLPLRGTPGDHVILMAGTFGGIVDYCPANVFVDGVLIRGSVDAVLIADWVEAVEVYPRAALAPAEFHLNDCGSVLYWTRERIGHGSWNWGKIAATTVLGLGLFMLMW